MKTLLISILAFIAGHYFRDKVTDRDKQLLIVTPDMISEMKNGKTAMFETSSGTLYVAMKTAEQADETYVGADILHTDSQE